MTSSFWNRPTSWCRPLSPENHPSKSLASIFPLSKRSKSPNLFQNGSNCVNRFNNWVSVVVKSDKQLNPIDGMSMSWWSDNVSPLFIVVIRWRSMEAWLAEILGIRFMLSMKVCPGFMHKSTTRVGNISLGIRAAAVALSSELVKRRPSSM